MGVLSTDVADGGEIGDRCSISHQGEKSSELEYVTRDRSGQAIESALGGDVDIDLLEKMRTKKINLIHRLQSKQ